VDARGSRFNGITCPLAGEHQVDNAITAVVALDTLGVPPQGIAETRWPGRLEVVAPNPDILLDGAHNPAGARALARYLERFYPQEGQRRRWMIFGAMRDKAIEEIGGILFPLADELIFTAAGYSRSLRPEALQEIAGRGRVAANVGEALAILRAEVNPDDLVIITGSLFLVGEARGHFHQTRQGWQ
jgi:dihydrofolate synthase/folylpolyglutamate synthase